MLKKNIIIWLPILLVIVLPLVASKYFDPSLIDYIMRFGTFASLAGLYYIILQIIKIKDISESTNEAVAKTHSSLVNNITRSNISRGLKTIQETQGLIRNKKYEISLIRLQEIKAFLIDMMHNNGFSEMINDFKIKNDIKKLQGYINSVDKEIQIKKNQDYTLDGSIINSYLESLSSKLSIFDTKLKYELECKNDG